MYRNTWMEIDLDQLYENIERIRGINGKRMIAVVKADGYGCGDLMVAKTAMKAGAEMLAVSSVDEAMILRNKEYDGPLLILGHTNAEDAGLMVKEQISAPAYSMNWVEQIIRQDCRGLKVHIKVDTGMNRIGFHTVEEIRQAMKLLEEHGCLIEGIFTHFACADSDAEMTQRQFETFRAIVEELNYPFEWIHCQNSDASVSLKETFSNAFRLGISMYGPSAFLPDLNYPVSLYSRIFLVKQVREGETIGYGATYTAHQTEWIGTIPIGYADGFIRRNQNRLLYCQGEYVPIVGRICMDQTMIHLPHQVQEGTVVEIFGPHVSIETMAKDLDTIPYEILCLISDRVTRVYKRDGRILAETNGRITESLNWKTI